MKAKGKMPGEQPKSKIANLPNARIPNAERKPNVARRIIPEPKRTNADTKVAQQNVTQDKRVQNKNQQRKVLLPIKLKSPPFMPKLANPSSKSPTSVTKAPSLSTLLKAPIRTPNAPKPPIPPSKRSNSVPALKKKPENNRPQTAGTKVGTEKLPAAAAQQHCARKPAEKPQVEKVVSSCNYESSNGTPLKIFPSFRGEYPTRHRPTACLQQWFQRTAAGKSHTEAVASIEIDDAGNDEVALDDNNCTTVTETHFLSIGCPSGCEPAAKTSCEYCVHVDTNNRRYEDYPIYSDQQTAARRTEAFTQHHQQQQQQQQPPPFASNWSQTSGDRSPYSCYQQPLQTCEVWSQSCLPQQAYQANSLNAMWPSSGGQTLSQNQYNNFRTSNTTQSTQQSQTNPTPPSTKTSTASVEQCLQEQQQLPLLVVSGNAAQDQDQELSQQESKQSSEENESSQRQSAAQGSGQQMSSAAPGGGQQPAKTTNSSGGTNEQSRAQAHLLALRMTEQVQQQMAQAQHQIAKVQVQLENGKAANESTEPSMNEAQSSQEQTEEQEPVQQQQQQQQQQQLPEETQSLLQQQSQTASNYPCEMFNQGTDLYQALTSQQTLMALAPMANPMMSNPMMANAMMSNPMMANPMMTNSMMANSYPLPFGDMQNSNFFTGAQPFSSSPLPPQAYGSGLMGQPMPPMSPQMPQNSFMGLPNNFPIPGFGHNGGNDGFMPPPTTPMPSQQNFDTPNMYPCQNNHCYMPCHRPRYNNMRFMMPRWH